MNANRAEVPFISTLALCPATQQILQQAGGWLDLGGTRVDVARVVTDQSHRPGHIALLRNRMSPGGFEALLQFSSADSMASRAASGMLRNRDLGRIDSVGVRVNLVTRLYLRGA